MILNKTIKVIALFLCFSLLTFAQTYEEAAEAIQEAETLQSEGQYDTSYEKSSEAAVIIDEASMKAFYKLMSLKILESKTKADAAIADARKVGASTDAQYKPDFDKAMTLYQNADVSNKAGISITNDITMASNNFTFSLNSYNTVALDVDKLKTAYINREKTATAKIIADAQAKYNASLGTKAIVKGDASDKAVNEALTAADKSLKADNFTDAKAKVNIALAVIAAADKKLMDSKALAQNAINEAQKKYDSAIAAKYVKKGDTNDTNVTALITDATKVLNQNNDNATAISKANEASKILDSLAKANELAKTENQKGLTDLKTRYDGMINNNSITKGSDTDKSVNGAIGGAENALKDDDQALAKTKISEGNTILDNVIKGGGTIAVEDDTNTVTETPTTPSAIDKTAATETTVAPPAIDMAGKVTVLPQYYIVVRRVPLTDALWRISGRSFIYNNPLDWETLYNANRNILRDSNNPNLILPGQRLTIPSLRGEKREGVYDPKREYITIEESLQLQQNQNTGAANN